MTFKIDNDQKLLGPLRVWNDLDQDLLQTNTGH